ncbi:MAG TPA: HAD-IC family P-type ATPase [Anaerolineales bacterium]
MSDANGSMRITEPWKRSWQEIFEELDVDEKNGLTEQAVKDRREKYGSNRLRKAERRSAWAVLIEQFRSLVVVLLVVAAIISFLFGEVIEAVAIGVVIAINAAIGFFTELRAVRSMEALQEMRQPSVRVKRAGKIREISAEEVVPGDIVILDSGDLVSADLRLVEAAKLQANESALTGESVPVSKDTEPLKGDVPLAERKNMLFKGTAVTRGSGEGIVVTTGMQTELGQISSLVEEAEEEATPLEEHLDQLGQRLVWVTLVIAAVIAISGILVGKDVFLIIETAIALAVATVPEGLPIVATIALARGMWRMANRNALINRLSAVETLGATNVICTDKTGTLTENRMTVTEILLPNGKLQVTGEGLQIDGQFNRDGQSIDPNEHEILRKTLEIGVLCNNASLQLDQEDDKAIGEPMEVALPWRSVWEKETPPSWTTLHEILKNLC